MAVERRYQERLAVDFPVRIRFREQSRFDGRARNISVEGMLINGGPRLPTGMLVELEPGFGAQARLIEALVVHSGKPGMGVMFLETQPELLSECRVSSRAIIR